LAAAATLVIVPGGLALYLRLRAQGLPDDPGIVVSLPSQFLIGIGVGYLLIPLLIVAGLAVIVLLVPGGRDEPNPKLPAPDPLWGKTVWGRVIGWIVTALVLCAIGAAGKAASLVFDSSPLWLTPLLIATAVALAVALWVLASALVAKQRRPAVKGLVGKVPAVDLGRGWNHWNGFLLLAFVAALAAGLPFAVDSSPSWWAVGVAAVTVTAWLAVSDPITQKYQTEPLGLMAVSMTALATILVFLPWGVAFAAYRGEFPNATVCTSDGGRFDGVLVGETADRVYVGEPQIEVVAFVVPEKLDDAITGLRDDIGAGVALEDDLEGVSFGRIDAVLVNLENPPFQPRGVAATGNAEPEQKRPSSLEALANKANAPELGFARADTLTQEYARAAHDDGIDVTRANNQVASNLPRLIDLVLRREKTTGAQLTPKPDRRIASIPSDRVTQIFVGGSGNCPALPDSG
jgi:hypothetical protein